MPTRIITSCKLVLTPPDYGSNVKAHNPVLHLLHGWGENETGWTRQVNVDFIMDNLISAGKAKSMIVVMDNLNAVKTREDGSIFADRGSYLHHAVTQPRPVRAEHPVLRVAVRPALRALHLRE